MHRKVLTRIGGVCVTAALVGCVGQIEIAPLPYAHPANPDAPPGRIPAVGTELNPGSSQTASQDDSNARGMKMQHHMKPGMKMDMGATKEMSATDGKFQCPMHSDVRSNTPGKCPRCGMKMKEMQAATSDESHDH